MATCQRLREMAIERWMKHMPILMLGSQVWVPYNVSGQDSLTLVD